MAEIKIGKLIETIHVTVSKVRRLRGTKGETVTSYAKVEFDGKSLGDSAKVESSLETEAEYNFTTSFDCSYGEGPITLDDVASKPILITIIEVLPKEKKQKEEKTAALSQCTVDLFPLFHAAQPLTYTLDLHSVLPTDTNVDASKPEIDVSLSVNEPLIDPEHLLHSNLLTVRLGSIYSIPDAWTQGGHYNYIVGLPVPHSGEKDASVLFSHGALKPASDKEPAKRAAKWLNVPNAAIGAQYIPNSARERVALEDEKGDLSGKEYAEYRRECESDRNRISWDVERRCYLPSDAKTVFQNRIAQTRLWPVEVMRTLPHQPKDKGGKKEKAAAAASVADDDGPISYHGVAYVDLAPLLYPGVCTVAGAFRIHPFNEVEMMEKTKQKNAISEDVLRVHSATSRATGTSPVQKGKGTQKDTSLHVPAGKRGSALRHAESTADVGESHFAESSAFVEHKTFVYLEFSLAHPLVPRRKAEELAKNVKEYIPPRPAMKRAVGGADKAVDDYHSQLSSVAVMVLDEFRQVCGDTVNEDVNKLGEMKKQLMYQLNSTGKYFAFKEQLKHSIVKIVREKYMKTTTFKSNEELQQFLTELYVFLIDEMHANLQKVFSVGSDLQENIEPVVDSAQLKRFAQEAEVNEDYENAAKYYQERLTKDEKDPEHWLDYGAFNLHIGNNSKAKHCFEQTIAIKQDHLEGLLLYGIMASMDQDYEEAETMLQRAVSVTQEGTTWSSLAWTVLALFYDSHGNEIRAEHAFLEAHRLNILAAVKKQEAEKAADRSSEVHSVSDHADSDRESDNVTTTTQQPPNPPAATRQISSSKAQSIRSAGSTAKGSKSVGKKDAARARSAGSSPSVEQKQDPGDDSLQGLQVQSIFLLAATWLLDHKALKFAEIALSKELIETRDYFQADYFIALSRLQLMKKQYDEATESLMNATTLDNEHPDGWAMLGHVNYVSSNFADARDCYERTLAFVNDASEMHSIYLRLASIYLQEEKFLNAKKVFLLACKHSPTCVAWLGVGIACFRLGEISEAEDALAEANILNNKNADVWAYLSLVCLTTGRKLEAEQSYKYALKLGLKEEVLLNEIHSLQKQLGFGNPCL